ncbi:stage II sporulation protein R [Halobacillus sp. BBL2006]|uniref:stage II sporulation protein R n=1 Tax=Halobacillus sp. BBL2006 TaxID=1543706 RepID=UPI0005427243|nr:stage II sporulation protein R [Halobacillus sp. BBL2006]KHE69208.1 stage II sporulation protein R [Halobacillus sp. BBL2006]
MKNSWLLLLTLCIIITALPWGQRMDAQPGESYQVIPDEAIRLRILADSNNQEDQQLKRQVRDDVNAEITKWVEDLNSIDAARQLIQDRLPEIETIVGNTIKEAGMQQSYTVDYDKNVSFPTKLYGNYIYPAGEYEAILITLGKGEGDNWWCVLFPPLCFLDFSNGTSVAEAEEDTPPEDQKSEEDKEVKFFVFELWGKLFS